MLNRQPKWILRNLLDLRSINWLVNCGLRLWIMSYWLWICEFIIMELLEAMDDQLIKSPGYMIDLS